MDCDPTKCKCVGCNNGPDDEKDDIDFSSWTNQEYGGKSAQFDETKKGHKNIPKDATLLDIVNLLITGQIMDHLVAETAAYLLYHLKNIEFRATRKVCKKLRKVIQNILGKKPAKTSGKTAVKKSTRKSTPAVAVVSSLPQPKTIRRKTNVVQSSANDVVMSEQPIANEVSLPTSNVSVPSTASHTITSIEPPVTPVPVASTTQNTPTTTPTPSSTTPTPSTPKLSNKQQALLEQTQKSLKEAEEKIARVPDFNTWRSDQKKDNPQIDFVVEVEKLLAEEKKKLTPNKKIMEHKVITKEMIQRYLCVSIAMGLVPIPNYLDHWASSGAKANLFGTNAIKAFMSRREFRYIHQFIHFEPDWLDLEFNKNFQQYWIPYKYMSVDECMIAFKGRVSFKQFLPSKPIKYGIKKYALCDIAGYMYSFFTYKGQKSLRSTKSVATIVQDFANDMPQDDQTRVLVFDNYYSSLKLSKSLMEKNVLHICTVRSNRPAQLFANHLQKQVSDKQREYTWLVYKNQLAAYAYVDSKRCNFLSNYSPSRLTNITNKVAKPQVVDDYNKGMGGVDKCDSFIGKYLPFPHKKNKWSRALFFHNIKTALVNSWLIYKSYEMSKATDQAKKKKINSMSQKEFLIKYLLANSGLITDTSSRHMHFPTKSSRDSATGKFPQQTCDYCASEYKRLTSLATPSAAEKAKVKKYKKKSTSKTSYKCLPCGRNLHVDCFVNYHKSRLLVQ